MAVETRADRSTPYFTMARLYASTSSFGRDYYGNPEIDPLIAEAAATLDRPRREALYHEVLDTLRQDVPAIWLAQLDDLYGAQANLHWQPRADSLLWLGGAGLGDNASAGP
jgi:ABC-type transport system substrate-binding protein